MGGKEESEMLGPSVFFIACVLPGLIEDLGEVYGHFCGGNFCGQGAKDCPAGKGPLSPDDARPYDIDWPLFRAKSKEQTCPRDGQPGCAFVDYVHTVRPSSLPKPLDRPMTVCGFRNTAAGTRGGRRLCSATRGATRSA